MDSSWDEGRWIKRELRTFCKGGEAVHFVWERWDGTWRWHGQGFLLKCVGLGKNGLAEGWKQWWEHVMVVEHVQRQKDQQQMVAEDFDVSNNSGSSSSSSSSKRPASEWMQKVLRMREEFAKKPRSE